MTFYLVTLSLPKILNTLVETEPENEDFCMFMDFSCDFPKDQPKQTR